MPQKMDSGLKSIVDKYPKLSIKPNEGNRFPIAHSGLKRGSLWVSRRVNSYAVVAVTGEEKPTVHDFLRHNFGPYSYIDQGREHWRVQSIEDVEKIIEFYGNL